MENNEEKLTTNTMENKPISAWGYVGYDILFALPIIGFIAALIFSLSKKGNINRRNLARAFFLELLLAIIIIIIAVVFCGVTIDELENMA